MSGSCGWGWAGDGRILQPIPQYTVGFQAWFLIEYVEHINLRGAWASEW